MNNLRQPLIIFNVIAILLFSISCNSDEGELIFVNEKPENNFNYPFFLYIPDGMLSAKTVSLIVEPNNSGFASDEFEEHIEKAERTASKDFYIGNYIARNLNYPLLVPVFPRSKTDWKVYSHALDRDVILQKDNSLERIDLQLIAMISEARSILKKMGYKVEDKIILSGFSASGTFANRFSMIHPEKIGAVIAGGVNGLLMLPYKKINDRIIEYPIGIGDFELLFGKEFDSAAFAELPQFLFMGENDDNDAVPYEDAFSNDERELIFELLGKKMQPERWNECRNLYKKKNLNADIITYSGIGHEHPEKIKEDILRFVENSEADK